MSKITSILVNCASGRLSQNLRTLRKSRNMSQDYLSQRLFISRSKYSSLENGWSVPDLVTLCMLADLYDTSLDALICSDFSEEQ